MFFHHLKKFNFLLVFIVASLLISCTSRKKLVYFQDQEGKASNEAISNYSSVLCKDDLLSITVSGIDLDAVKPFNPFSATADKNLNQIGYLIDSAGEIEFPVVGKIKVVGLSRTAASELIAEKLKIYINTPIVNIHILNFKITILGEVRTPGTYVLANDRTTLPQALGMAGDLLITGMRKNILLIRETEGKKIELRVDLTSKELFNSPAYFLHQNDVIYVEPNKTKINSSVVNAPNVSLVISAVSILVTLAVLITNLR